MTSKAVYTGGRQHLEVPCMQAYSLSVEPSAVTSKAALCGTFHKDSILLYNSPACFIV